MQRPRGSTYFVAAAVLMDRIGVEDKEGAVAGVRLLLRLLSSAADVKLTKALPIVGLSRLKKVWDW